MNDSEFEKDYPIFQFENDKDAVKMSIFYFIELAMIGSKKEATHGLDGVGSD